MTYFVPRDKKEHERGNRGYEVADYCTNCGFPFMEHINGKCPDKEDPFEDKKSIHKRTV